MRLKNKVAVITGAANGIGRAIAIRFAREGARVAINDINKAAGQALESQIKLVGGTSFYLHGDAVSERDVSALMNAVNDKFGRLDILVNNAGTSIRKPPETYTAAEWHAVLDTNLTGAFLCSQAAHPVMKHSGGGKIINIGSMFALFGSAYAAP